MTVCKQAAGKPLPAPVNGIYIIASTVQFEIDLIIFFDNFAPPMQLHHAAGLLPAAAWINRVAHRQTVIAFEVRCL